MLRLPIGFFETTSTGQVTSKLGEIGRIRGFLLNSVFGTLLDGVCLIVFIPVLFFVSTPLSLLVLAGCAAILLANLAFMPELSTDVRIGPPGDMRKGSPVQFSVIAAYNPWWSISSVG